MSDDLAMTLYRFATDWDARKPMHERDEPWAWEELTDDERAYWRACAEELRAEMGKP